MRSIKRSLTDAVDACIEAAGHEVAPATQRTLLKVISVSCGVVARETIGSAC